MATRPAAFRPSRKSMGAVIEKENFSQQSEIITDELITIPTTKRKRAQSLGGNEPIAKKVVS